MAHSTKWALIDDWHWSAIQLQTRIAKYLTLWSFPIACKKKYEKAWEASAIIAAEAEIMTSMTV